MFCARKYSHVPKLLAALCMTTVLMVGCGGGGGGGTTPSTGSGGGGGSAGCISSGSSISISASAHTSPQSMTVGTAMTSFTPLTATDGACPYTFSYTGTLPSGLRFNTGTGAVTGTPTATYPTANLVFSVQDANNVVANTTSTVSFSVVGTLTFTGFSSYSLASIPNLGGSNTLDSTGTTGAGKPIYWRTWQIPNSAISNLEIGYTDDTPNGQYLTYFQAVPGTANPGFGVSPTNFIGCFVTGTNTYAYPSCSGSGITIDRTAGTLTMAATPVSIGTVTGTATGGAFTFTPF